MSEKFKRQSDLINQEDLSFNIHIIGVGGIGSWVALLATKMGCTEVHIYDDDIVELHNTSSQFFEVDQEGKPKVDAISDNIKKQSGISVFKHPQKDEEKITDGLVIIAVDSMEERHKLYEMFKDKNVYIIDGRMGGLQMEIHKSTAKDWNKTLVDPEMIQPDKCTARAICFNCAVIGGLITNYIRLYSQNKLKDGAIVMLLEPEIFLGKEKDGDTT